MRKISRSAYQERLDRLTEIFSGIVDHADAQARNRCPYRDRADRCTAAFACRNRIPPEADGERPSCGHDGAFDYRLAWETDPGARDRAKARLERIRRSAAARRGGAEPAAGPGTIAHGAATRPLVAGLTLFDHADALAAWVPTSCHRNGRCHECVVEVTRGEDALAARTEAESFLRGRYRLACQAVVARADRDVAFAPLHRRPRILAAPDRDAPQAFDPLVTRRGEEVLYDGAPIDRYRGRILGLAVDLGTTTVVLDFVDLESGRSVHGAAFENPQAFGGSDVMHRISYDREDATGALQKAAASAINRASAEACARLGVGRNALYEIVVAGNPTMRDVLFKLDVQGIGQRPYKSLVEKAFLAGERADTALRAQARRLGLRTNPQARAYGLPLIASHVGGDTAAGLAALEEAFAGAETAMLVDMGTNTEVVLKHRGRMLAASCPAGPAFEGGLVRYGMPACDGAIEAVRLGADGAAAWETIGGGAPAGLCGSGLIDLLAELRCTGQLTAKGAFTADRKRFEIAVVPEHGITFSREDASNLGQAKAANYCGQYIVMRALGVDPASVERLYLAGGFATYVNVRNAIAIGLLAPVPEERVVKVGNAAARGARAILLSGSRRRALERRVQAIAHVELETTPDFFDLFVDGCQFKPMPSVLAPQGEPA